VADPVWLTIFSLALLFFVIVRILRKKTKMLHLLGR
jgi:hypothetical protein